MTHDQIRRQLDQLIKDTTTYDKRKLPAKLLSDIQRWRWGSYGWISPVSLLFTAAWRKFYFPSVDCCKIWASDENGNTIVGGYSIRSEDESISVPLLAKYDLCEGFCSPNSGMQGSRAIEKMRTLKRLNRDFASAQRTIFDLKLFASIMNQTNELNQDQLAELIKLYICTAKEIQQKRKAINAAIQSETVTGIDLLNILADTADPEFTKCVTASCLYHIYKSSGIELTGVEDMKTAADARARKPGDLTLEKSGTPIMAVEVKDKTQHIDWNNIERAKRIINQNPNLSGFLFVLESRDAATSAIINEMVNAPQLATRDGKIISIMSLHDLHSLALVTTTEAAIAALTGRFLTMAPAVKPETKEKWLRLIKR